MSRKIGLLIGNGSFGATSGFAPLRCPAKDVEGFRRLLTDEVHGGFEVTTLVDRTQREIQLAVQEVLRDTASFDDLVVLYYSGHGSPDSDGDLFLAAVDTTKSTLDATGVAIEYVVKRMRSSRSQRIVLILDCCFSGSVERLFTSSRGEVAEQVRASLQKELAGTGLYMPSGATETMLIPEHSGSGIYVLTASTATQVAEEREGDDYGLLTKHILSGIGEGRADLNKDGVVTMHELTVYVQQAVKREGRQEPLGFTYKGGGGELEIARTRPLWPAMREEVETAIWRARREFHVPLDVIQCNLALIGDEVLEEGGEAARRRLEHLHRLTGDIGGFIRKLHELSAAETKRLSLISVADARPYIQESIPAGAKQKGSKWTLLNGNKMEVSRWALITIVVLAVMSAALWNWKRVASKTVRGGLVATAPLAGGDQISQRTVASDPGSESPKTPGQLAIDLTNSANNQQSVGETSDAGRAAASGRIGMPANKQVLLQYSYRTPGTGCEGSFLKESDGIWEDFRPGAKGCPELHFLYKELSQSSSYIVLQLSGFNEYRRLPLLSSAKPNGVARASSSPVGPWAVLWTVNLEPAKP